MAKHPIGIFDSGYGGLTVYQAIKEQMPEYDYLYLGDNARAPYGNRSVEEIYSYTLEAVTWLIEKGCPLVILACNTASATALRRIQQQDLASLGEEKRVLGVIRPTAEEVGLYTKTGSVGILGTSGTISAGTYPEEIAEFYPEIKVTQQACPIWVPIVEYNEYKEPGADFFIHKYINMLLKQASDIDLVLLACTHYPILLDKILKFTPPSVKVLTQGDIVARSLRDYLDRHTHIKDKITKSGQSVFYTSGLIEDFKEHAQIFLEEKIDVLSK